MTDQPGKAKAATKRELGSTDIQCVELPSCVICRSNENRQCVHPPHSLSLLLYPEATPPFQQKIENHEKVIQSVVLEIYQPASDIFPGDGVCRT